MDPSIVREILEMGCHSPQEESEVQAWCEHFSEEQDVQSWVMAGVPSGLHAAFFDQNGVRAATYVEFRALFISLGLDVLDFEETNLLQAVHSWDSGEGVTEVIDRLLEA